jgi:hypothetical protein
VGRSEQLPKPELEFFDTASVGWTPCSGSVSGLTERVLALDSSSEAATRLLHFLPGTDTSANGVQVHDFWEEVYILEGSITDLTLQEGFSAGMYACRPPNMRHGPWVSPGGCLTFEVRYRA